MILLTVVLTLFSVLSAFASLAMFSYLILTERKAPHIGSFISRDEETTASRDTSLVSIIIAARNEEDKIARCISSLINQTYAKFEVIVVDDNSIDNTLSVSREFQARDERVHVISPGVKPEGWVGKSWPCQKAFELSKGELLLFLDADSFFDPHVLEYCVKYFENASLDMFSISASVELKGNWCRATVPLVSAGINLLYPMEKVNDKKSKRAYVFGTFILVRRSTYSSIGGHKAIRERIVEDAALAQLAKSKGYKLQIMIGDDFATTDWESDFPGVYHGMERIFSDSIRPYGLISLLNAVLIFFIGLYPILYIIGFAVYSIISRDVFLANNVNSFILNAGFFASVVCVLVSLSISTNELKLAQGRRRSRNIGFAPLLYPLGYFLFMSAIFTSTLKVSQNKGLEWKGQKFNQEVLISRKES